MRHTALMNIADDSVFTPPEPQKPPLQPFFQQFTALWWTWIVVGLIVLIGVYVLSRREYLSAVSPLVKFWTRVGAGGLVGVGLFGLYMSY
ncbi:MAG: hypothetical protein DI630_26560 [Gordonia sp. (in: high G+C Gram-positive bacteria)]|nr:MAG: hypothetical protein DI630_26560 [Gordonia sp. (in: high G+C Gram-positive bacteria)]